ncbi:CAP domain-containing protein [Corynebacterium kroppenstedtii]|uniref:CAP domain-containing protein n=1 Tax=Corynebacterium sp. PCR 32 TaxID=3351342 RepID=UPI0030AE44B8
MSTLKKRIALSIPTLALAAAGVATGAAGIATAAETKGDCPHKTVTAPSTQPVSDTSHSPAKNQNSWQANILKQTNAVRAKNHVAPLKVKANDNGAQRWAEHMANTGKFYHDSHGVQTQFFAENIYQGPVSQAVDAWEHSSGHFQNMVNPKYRYLGVGIAKGRNGQTYVVQRFYFK